MGQLLNIVTPLHTRTKRDYLGRMNDNKPEAMQVARQYGQDFWDGARRYGYGGYTYDGRWEPVARALIEHYDLKDGCSILDIGCGKGFLLYELSRILPRSIIAGFDISSYAIQNAKEEIRKSLFVHYAQHKYPYADKEFDLVISLTTLHNLYLSGLYDALSEVQRVAKKGYIVVESFRNEEELFNLQCWALTCNSFYTPEQWQWLFKHARYHGDYEFIYFT
jgi:ubiquinone/menaquinone biosynthesis C-methylase UbiE